MRGMPDPSDVGLGSAQGAGWDEGVRCRFMGNIAPSEGFAATERVVRWIRAAAVALLSLKAGVALAAESKAVMSGPKPKIAIFSGPTATIQNSYALITSNKARRERGLDLLTGTDGKPLPFDRLHPQRLAAPMIERNGGKILGLADFDFYRAAPSGGYTKGLSAAKRTDRGTGDIPPEKRGMDFFRYGEHRADAPRGRLALATTMIQKAMSSGEYAGGVWLEGSPNVEETTYRLHLLIDTTRPIVCHSAQRARGYISADGDGNMVEGVKYILSRKWADELGQNRLGGVLIVDMMVFSGREVPKGDARPGGYVASGGFGGIVGAVGYDTVVTFIPNRKHTYLSEVRVTALPAKVTGVKREGTGIQTVEVAVKEPDGVLRPEAMPAEELSEIRAKVKAYQ